MSLITLSKQNFDAINIKSFASRNYISGSSLCFNTVVGETGCVPAISSRSKCIKDVDNRADFANISLHLSNAENRGSHIGKTYLTLKNEQSHGNLLNSPTSNYLFKIKRNSIKYESPEPLDSDNINNSTSYTKLSFIKNNLYTFYKNNASNLDDFSYGFFNYNTLNFFTLGINTGYTANDDKTHKTCLLYNNFSNRYTPSSIENKFTFECWLNPKRSNINSYNYNYGTIIHVPFLFSAYLINGTSIDEFGNNDKFRIQVQLGSEANSLPDSGLLTHLTSSLTDNKAITVDNCLTKNNWHHLAVTYESQNLKIFIDGNSVLDLETTTAISPITASSVVTIGNRLKETTDTYWDTNKSDISDYFFGTDIFQDYGLNTAAAGTRAASSFDINTAFDNDLDANNSTSLALNAEINDIRLYSNSRLKTQINLDKNNFVKSLTETDHEDLVFYVPVYFIPEKISRKTFKSAGNKNTYTFSSPVNPFFAHTVLGHEVSVEHFTKELVKGYRPYINGIHDQSYLGEASLDSNYTEDLSFNEKLCNLFLTDDTTTADRREDNLLLRNYLVLPCDNGLTYPRHQLISEVSSNSNNFIFRKDIFGNFIDNIVSLHTLIDLDNDDININYGPRIPSYLSSSLYRQDRVIDNLDVPLESSSNNHNNLRTYSSNQNPSATFANTKPLTSNNYDIRRLPFYEITTHLGELHSCTFDIPNPFYSSAIRPESIEIEDRDILGSAGILSIKVKDNEKGQMYRCDSLTKPAKWNYIGHAFRREGFVTILHPGLSTFGANSFDFKLKGTQGLNVYEINIPCEDGSLNVSLNKSYKEIKPTDYKSDSSESFVFIDAINLHDENLNIVAKAQLSKPLAKRVGDKYNFRLKLDY